MKNIVIIIACIGLSILANKASAQVDERAFKTVPIRDSLVARVGKLESVNGWILGNIIDRDNNVLLALGDPFPNQVITLIIQEADKNKFPSNLYKNMDVIATGILQVQDGKLQMLITDPKQIVTAIKVIRNY